MKKLVFVVLVGLFPITAFAQQPPVDPKFCATALPIVQNQRNIAQDSAAGAATQLQMAQEQIAELKKQVEDLTKKLENPTNVKPPADH